jgi:hypothetical protein
MHAGLAAHGLTSKDACNLFLAYCGDKVKAGAIAGRTYHDYSRIRRTFASRSEGGRLVGDPMPLAVQD